MIYLDNAATSWPKPPSVRRAAERILSRPLGNPGRSGHPPAAEAAGIVYRARESAARLLGMEAPERVCFFGGATQALNAAVLGTAAALSKDGGRISVCATVFEHNAVLRPLYALEKAGRIRLEILEPAAVLPRLERAPPRLLALTLVSNVTGWAPPLAEISRLCRRAGCVLLADASQAAGHMPLEEAFARTDLLCAPGHKGLFGMMGAGFLAIRPGAPVIPEAVFTGGSGSLPQSRAMPDLLPERLEAGTLPVAALATLAAGIDFVLERDPRAIRDRERALKRRLTEGLSVIPGVTVFQPEEPDGPLLYRRRGVESEAEAGRLAESGVCARAGFHCAPLAHAYLATGQSGAVRLSPGLFNTTGEIDAALRLISRAG